LSIFDISYFVDIRIDLMSKSKDKKMATLFKALGHPVRVEIVRLLQGDGACFAGDISRRLPVAASTASQHLKILKEAGIITGTIDGPHRCYCIDKTAYHELKDWIDAL
jgi:ArsR family transcriptional regulator